MQVQTQRGVVEYETAGDGTPVLVVHGTPGGSGQGVVLGRFLAEAGMRVVAPSRPGYLETPLGGCSEIDAQADLHAALLDALSSDRVGVLCWSGGGPSSYRLAVRHPDRVVALVAVSAVSQTFVRAPAGIAERLMPDHGEHAATTIPGAQRVVMDGGTHLCLWTHPDGAETRKRAAALVGGPDG